MEAEDNKFLAEQMGMCWHEWEASPDDFGVLYSQCSKCNDIEDTDNQNPDFSTDSGFVKALLWAQVLYGEGK